MNKLIAIACAATAIMLTEGCATHGNAVALGVEAPYADYPYDGFYDGFYGPYFDGYWGADGFFYYSDGRGGFRRDDGQHFRHEAADGFHGVRAHGGSFRTGEEGFRGGSEGFRAGGGGGRG